MFISYHKSQLINKNDNKKKIDIEQRENQMRFGD